MPLGPSVPWGTPGMSVCPIAIQQADLLGYLGLAVRKLAFFTLPGKLLSWVAVQSGGIGTTRRAWENLDF